MDSASIQLKIFFLSFYEHWAINIVVAYNERWCLGQHCDGHMQLYKADKLCIAWANQSVKCER